MNNPDNVQTLLIRACKSKNPGTRVNSVYRRFYLNTRNPKKDMYIAGILTDIVEEFCPIRLSRLLGELGDSPMFLQETDLPYWTKVKRILISHIRMSHKAMFGDIRIR